MRPNSSDALLKNSWQSMQALNPIDTSNSASPCASKMARAFKRLNRAFLGLRKPRQGTCLKDLHIVVDDGDAVVVTLQAAVGVVGGGRDGDHEALAGELRRDVARLAAAGPSERWEQGAGRIELEVEVEVSLAQRLALEK